MYKCPVCGKEISRPQNLKIHARTHDIEIPDDVDGEDYVDYIEKQHEKETKGGENVSDSTDNDKFADGIALAKDIIKDAKDGHGINNQRSKSSNKTEGEDESEGGSEEATTGRGGSFFPLSPATKKWVGFGLAAAGILAAGTIAYKRGGINLDNGNKTGTDVQQNSQSGNVENQSKPDMADTEHKDNGKGNASNLARASEIR